MYLTVQQLSFHHCQAKPDVERNHITSSVRTIAAKHDNRKVARGSCCQNIVQE
jgi:hypothetical protein